MENKSKPKKAYQLLQEVYSAAQPDKFETAINILRKIVTNIVNDPNNDKFRNVRKTNKVLAEKLFIHKNIDELLTLFDFAYDDVDGVYSYFGDDPNSLSSLLIVADGFEVQIEAERNNKNVDPEKAKERSLVIQKEMDDKNKAMKELQDRVKGDRIEKEDEMHNRPVTDSVAKERQFGAKVKHCKDILPPPGRK